MPHIRECRFACRIICSDRCCGGATVITISEIPRYFMLFPITIGFRKYIPVGSIHEKLLESVGFRWGDAFVVGDFIAGNRHADRCSQRRDDGLCGLHDEPGKPLQCTLVPFCAVYPEKIQNRVFQSRRFEAYRNCLGYGTDGSELPVVWSGNRFTEPGLRSAFLRFQRGMRMQKSFMREFFTMIESGTAAELFREGDGILESHIPSSHLFLLLETAGFREPEMFEFIKEQICLCDKTVRDVPNPVISNSFDAMTGILEAYSEYLENRKEKTLP